MKAQYAILRFAKYKGPEIGHIEAHNERTKEKYASNPDVDTSRSHLNFHLVTPQRKYRAEVEKQIAKKLSLQGISLSDVAILRAQGGSVASMVTKDGKPLELTQREYELLTFLASHPNKVYSRIDLMEQVWNYGYVGDDARTVDVTVRRLREKIEDNPASPVYILTRRGVGYYFSAQA